MPSRIKMQKREQKSNLCFCSISYLLVGRKCNPLIHLERNTFVLILFSSCAVVCFTVAAFTFPYEAFSKVSISISRGQGVHYMFRWQAWASEECHCYRWDQSAAFYCNCGVQPVEVEVWFFGVASQKLWKTLRAPRGLDRIFLKGANGVNCVTRGSCHIVICHHPHCLLLKMRTWFTQMFGSTRGANIFFLTLNSSAEVQYTTLPKGKNRCNVIMSLS